MDTITHEALAAELNKAKMEVLVLAARAIITARLWDLSEEELRVSLQELAHMPNVGHDAVWAALGLDLPDA